MGVYQDEIVAAAQMHGMKSSKHKSDKSTTFNELKHVNLNRTSLIFSEKSLSIV